MKNKIGIYSLVILLASFSGTVSAKRYWPSKALTNWDLHLNNGVAYIRSPDFASHCRYLRGQINMDGTEFNKSQYAYALAAYAQGKTIRYVVDDEQTICIVTGIDIID